MAKLSSVKSQAAYHAASAAKPNTKSAKANQSSGKAASSASKSRTTSNKVSPQQAKKNYEQAMSRVKGNAVKATNGKTSNSPKPSNVKKDSFTKTNEKTKTEKQAVITQKAYSKAVTTAKTQSKSTTTATTTKYTTKSYESEKIKYLQNEIKNTSSLYKKSELQKEIEFIKIKNKNNNSSITSNTNSYSNKDFKLLPFSSSYIVLNNEDHQRMLMSLGECTPQNIKDYSEQQGITLDGYTFIGICIGESTGGQTSNYFGSVANLSQKSKNLAASTATQALINAGIASNENDAEIIMSKDDFYFQAGCVVSYLNNTVNNNGYITDCYESLTNTMISDINAWRKGEKNGGDSSSGYDTRFTYRGN